MQLRPVAGHIHVRPDLPPTQSDGGLYIPDALVGTIPPMSGTVVAVGPPDPRSQAWITKVRAQVFRDCLLKVEEVSETFRHTAELQVLREELAGMLRCEPTPERTAQIGDHVLFPASRGYDIVLGEDVDARTIILKDTDVLAVIEPAVEVAA